MKFRSWFAIFALLAVSAAGAAESRYAGLRGTYAATMTTETGASAASGSVTVKITTQARRPDRASLTLSGALFPANTISGTGNPLPVQATLRLRGGRVRASDFLLGLGAERRTAVPARFAARGSGYRFAWRSARGEGRLRGFLRVKAGQLELRATGVYRPRGAAGDPVRIVITGPRG